MNHRNKCIIILSTRSAGSTALYRYLTSYPQINGVNIGRILNRRYTGETAYWENAAALMGYSYPTLGTFEGGVIPYEMARAHLVNLLVDNLGPEYRPPNDDHVLIFDGWRQLCHRFGPIFVEKSPHHLYRWVSLQLIVECIRRFPEIDFLLIGLVRNPMATHYSQWKRWKFDPSTGDHEWYVAYRNLIRLKDKAPHVHIIKYEDIVADSNAALARVYEFANVVGLGSAGFFHSESLMKWKKDNSFNYFQLSPKTAKLAKKHFGYNEDDLINPNYDNAMALGYRKALRAKAIRKLRWAKIYKIASTCAIRLKQLLRFHLNLRKKTRVNVN